MGATSVGPYFSVPMWASYGYPQIAGSMMSSGEPWCRPSYSVAHINNFDPDARTVYENRRRPDYSTTLSESILGYRVDDPLDTKKVKARKGPSYRERQRAARSRKNGE